jgi:exopolysaccharide biosynthesis polyprenyl glycosylphosphotransferase
LKKSITIPFLGWSRLRRPGKRIDVRPFRFRAGKPGAGPDRVRGKAAGLPSKRFENTVSTMKKLISNIVDLLHVILVWAFDTFTMMGCFWLGFVIWVGSPYRMKPHVPAFDWIHVFFYIVLIESVLIWGGTYKRQSSMSHVIWLKELVKYSLIGFGGAILASFFAKFLLVGRLQAFFTFTIMLPAILVERSLLDKIWTSLIVEKFLLKRIVIYGAGNTGKRLAKSITKNPKLGYRIIGFFDDDIRIKSVVMANPYPIFGGKEKFLSFVVKKRKTIDEVHIAMPAAGSRTVKGIMKICDQYKIPFKFVPNFSDLMLHRLDQEQIDGIPLFSIGDLRISTVNRIVKRVSDVLLSIPILVLSLPAAAIVCLIIRRNSPGPAIFKQKRIGFKGREFVMYKFRTMFISTPPYFWHPQKNKDPRITRVGRILRKTSLDEFPQFWNVIKGDMSIVGPRPEMPFIVETYNTYQRERLNAKPGITGLWQISGDRSLPIHENIDHDLYYIHHQSLLLDLLIILQTVWFALIRGVGAK